MCSCQVKAGEGSGVETFVGRNSLKQPANNLTNKGFLQCVTTSPFLGSLRNSQTQKIESKVFQELLYHVGQN